MDQKSFAETVLLDKIDKLFAAGVGDHIDLPQLIVAGMQSSGKSSVLEGLTGLPFPRDSDLCTRFATQITFRRAPSASVSVSVIPAGNATRKHAEEVRAWSKHGVEKLDVQTFADIMREVCTVMGIGEPGEGDHVTFSEDVLKLEICGPDQEHFSVVDVPGIFKKTTEGVTTKHDMSLVYNMVHGYMNNPRSVILAVIPANVDVANQEVLTMAEEADPDGIRTLGVLTKPDLVDQGAEQNIIDMVNGAKHRLNLGWCLVRNLSQKQSKNQLESRHVVEQNFFKYITPWNSIDKGRVGVAALRQRLQGILGDIIRRSFRLVRADIHRRLTECRRELQALGGDRDTPEAQRIFLTDLSVRFQQRVSDALNAKYSRDKCFSGSESLKIATMFVNRSEQFAEDMQQKGHRFGFKNPGVQEHFPTASTAKPTGQSNGSQKPSSSIPAKFEEEVLSQDAAREQYPELAELLPDEILTLQALSSSQVDQSWLRDVYTANRGFELGTFNGELLANTMQQQSANWPALSNSYICDVIVMSHRFIQDLLRHCCPDTRLRDGILGAILDNLVVCYGNARAHVDLLLSVERAGTPATLNHYFNDNLQRFRQRRRRSELEKKSVNFGFNGQPHVALDAAETTVNQSNTAHVVNELADILQAYYKVARKRFVDNICMQAADYHLITGPNTALRCFSPAWVQRLTAEQLDEIAGEDTSVRRKRQALTKEMAALEAGKKIAS